MSKLADEELLKPRKSPAFMQKKYASNDKPKLVAISRALALYLIFPTENPRIFSSARVSVEDGLSVTFRL